MGLLKIDKASRWRIMNPAYFFARRLLTAMLLTLPIENTFIFLQYVFILMSSHAYILYMVACKPYQTPALNSYVLANETFYQPSSLPSSSSLTLHLNWRSSSEPVL